jgi:triacylglycerol lipase
MTGRRTVVGLSLLCALLLSAIAAPSASATNGTTAFTCSSGAGIKDFSDAHCDKAVSEGSFGHIEVEPGLGVEIEITNAKTKGETKESTPAIFKGTIAGVAGEITCTTVSGSGKATNKEVSEVMQNEGTGLVIKYTGCTMNKPAGCKVKEPIEETASSITVENLGASKTEMGVEYKPKEKTFGQITLEGAECLLKGKTFSLEGTMIATGSRGDTEATTSSGGTFVFTNAMTKETLKVAGNAAEFSATYTISRKQEGEGWPLSLTTVGKEEEVKCGEPEGPEENCENWEVSEKAEKELEEELEKGFEWPPEESEKVEEEEEAAGHYPILFMHGLSGDESTFKTMVQKFEEAGWDKGRLFNWVHDWRPSHVKVAGEVKETVDNILEKLTKAKKVDIITHSSAALSARYYIKNLEGTKKVKHFVSLAGANHGTTWAKSCSWKYVACEEMLRGSKFLQELNENETPGAVKYGTWRGGYEFGVPCDWIIIPPSSAELGGKAKNTVAKGCVGHYGIHEDKETFEQVSKFLKE